MSSPSSAVGMLKAAMTSSSTMAALPFIVFSTWPRFGRRPSAPLASRCNRRFCTTSTSSRLTISAFAFPSLSPALLTAPSTSPNVPGPSALRTLLGAEEIAGAVSLSFFFLGSLFRSCQWQADDLQVPPSSPPKHQVGLHCAMLAESPQSSLPDAGRCVNLRDGDVGAYDGQCLNMKAARQHHESSQPTSTVLSWTLQLTPPHANTPSEFNVPVSFTVGTTPAGTQYLIPSFLQPATDVALEAEAFVRRTGATNAPGGTRYGLSYKDAGHRLYLAEARKARVFKNATISSHAIATEAADLIEDIEQKLKAIDAGTSQNSGNPQSPNIP
ncbi:hypothetical protein NP233_g7368 [Leucocoprinus birnbaumii]|uniref:Uncharacterized protein n=1 Tax=Leucocoprinus birnbaumii TaxID=56174 RepID=A0AAD5VSP1_9AGAR|nr:hypothetical protein NP233_g7368 [Leucocoprinus birnbaumii]